VADKVYISGAKPLRGEVQIGGSKNSTLAIMAACLLVPGEVRLSHVPAIGDIRTMAAMLAALGARVERRGHEMCIDATCFRAAEAPEELVRKMRASFYVLGPMLARWGRARAALPGGCDIGTRPVDYHMRGLRALGAEVEIDRGFITARTRGLTGGRIYLDFPSCGATSHLMTTACLARGVTTIENAASEPEITDLAEFLTRMGAQIHGQGTSTITVQGVDRLHGGEYTVVPDRMEAGTYAVAAAITGGAVTLRGVVPEHLQPVIMKMREMGVSLTSRTALDPYDSELRVHAAGRPKAVDILAMPHPGFPTDMQQPVMALLSLCEGSAVITDRVFESRFKYVAELRRMGADIRLDGRTAVVRGVEKLTGASVRATDLRAGAALIVAALAARGDSEISGLEHLDRGYEDMSRKLSALGAEIERTATTRPMPAAVEA